MNAPPEKLGSFYLGGLYDLKSRQITETPINYDARDLTTHAVCLGMTGSGKTGLCIGLLEEAALDKVPAIIVDPKGDMTNLMLQFPNLKPEDFKPWINTDDARRKGKSVDEYSRDVADLWRNGLSDWGITSDRIKSLGESVDFAIFTPGSDAGIPISILSSLAAPDLDYEENTELIREQITGTVGALLELVGVKGDSVRSREAILLSTIFEFYWSKNEDLDLEKLITSIQKPPFRKLGVFDVDTFYPEKDRFQLAMAFNSLIASPNFQSWLQGEQLDIGGLLYTKEGKPRHCIFYLAHLSERERMYFVTLLLEKVLMWVRRQTGTTSLRALLYFDEVFGFMPPVAEPPSKRPLITLLKQARAFGFGVVLVTQNPVDIDYKALTNTGTWFIGKLQTERDKSRVLDGLKGATSQYAGEKEPDFSGLIGGLTSRVFLYHNVHEKEPVVFYTRWAMSYLRGPLTRPQVRQMMADRKKVIGDFAVSKDLSPVDKAFSGPQDLSKNPPTLSPAIPQLFFPVQVFENQAKRNLAQKLGDNVVVDRMGLLYRPVIFGNSSVRFLDRKRKIDHMIEKNYVLQDLESVSFVDWKSAKEYSMKVDELLNEQESGIDDRFFEPIPEFANSPQEFKSLAAALKDYIYYNAALKLKKIEELDVVQKPEESDRDFQIRALQLSRERRDSEVDKLKEKYAKKLDKLEDKIQKLEFNLSSDEAEYQARKREEVIGAGESVLGIFLGSRRTSTATTAARKRRMTSKAKRKVTETKEELAEAKKDARELEGALKKAVEQIVEHYEKGVENVTYEELKPRKTDVKVNLVALAWEPYWRMHYKDRGILQTTILDAHNRG
ncbi:MAG TPA: DUF87 domain-containing protein [Candidatus Bathyarchaeota archaeon]|nr:DUF87 domain-containing protein [Candidatus Bathyarchaeota archaeon]